MSPLFHRSSDGGEEASSHGRLPSLYELGSQVDDVVKSAASLPLEQFAEHLMTQFFTTEYMLASKITSVSSVDTICWNLLPDNSGENAHDPIPDAFFCLQDLVTEAVQLLRTAGLVMERSYKVGQGGAYSQWLSGLVTTRRGRAALADNTVGQILSQLYA